MNEKRCQTGTTTTIRDARLSASWGPHSSPETPHHPTQHYCIEGFKGALNLSPIMPRDVSLSDSQCKFFQSGTQGEMDFCVLANWNRFG